MIASTDCTSSPEPGYSRAGDPGKHAPFAKYSVEIRGEEVPITNTYRLAKLASTRQARGMLIHEAGMVHPREDGTYFVESVSSYFAGDYGVGWIVDLGQVTCECPDWTTRGAELGEPPAGGCQHMIAAQFHRFFAAVEMSA